MNKKAASSYIEFLPNASRHLNSAQSHAGIGRTRDEATKNAQYWANQNPYTRVVPISRAPQWAIDEAVEALRTPCIGCGGPNHDGACLDRDGYVLPEFSARAKIWESKGCPAQYSDGEKINL